MYIYRFIYIDIFDIYTHIERERDRDRLTDRYIFSFDLDNLVLF